MKIANFKLLADGVFIVAELSANHNGSLDNAIATIKEAAKAGANAIKLQTYTADTLTLDCDNEHFQIKSGSLWDGKTLYQLYKEAYTPWEWHKELFQVAKEEGLICFSSPFDRSAVDFLEELNTPAYKIASFEIQDIPLIKYAASKMKPMILSTGISELEDIELAIQTIKDTGNNDIILLKCTSAYPASLEEVNLRTISDMQSRFNLPIGLSDHTLGVNVPIASVALGACMIEKHFIADKAIGGPDASFSLEPAEFKQMVDAVRDVEKAMGQVNYTLSEKVKQNRVFSRSLFIAQEVQEGEIITEKNVRSVRPGYGLHPKHLE
ncbi:MAG: pseudaminic acid synthase, partial [Campylobacterota bacterium]|nr:pseudaminic acid synthase [Campylobacterota bacterium]